MEVGLTKDVGKYRDTLGQKEQKAEGVWKRGQRRMGPLERIQGSQIFHG